MIHIICALKPEARPLMDYYDLQRQPKTGSFQIYQGPDGEITLTLSGIGKSAASQATNFTHDYFKSDKSHAWINIGTAGHATLPIGQAVIIKKIIDADSGHTWFPSRVFATTLPACELLTLDKPGRDYQAALFDMESAGFFQTVTGFAALELVHVVKIISDNASQSMDEINPAFISRLITKNLPAIDAVIQQLLLLSRKQQRVNHIGDEFEAILQRRHFTVYQRLRLKTLIRKWQVLYPRETSLERRLAEQKSAKQILEYLQNELDNAPINLH